jgi:hypothetical protein
LNKLRAIIDRAIQAQPERDAIIIIEGHGHFDMARELDRIRLRWLHGACFRFQPSKAKT